MYECWYLLIWYNSNKWRKTFRGTSKKELYSSCISYYIYHWRVAEKHKEKVHPAIVVKPFLSGNWSSFQSLICLSKKKRSTHVNGNRDQLASFEQLVQSIFIFLFDSSVVGADQSGKWAPLIGSTKVGKPGGWVVMAGVVAASSYTWRCGPASINTDTFVLITVSPVSCTDPFIWHCRTPMFLHYNTVYMIYFSLSATDNSHSMTNTGLSKHRLSYLCIRSGHRIRRDLHRR